MTRIREQKKFKNIDELKEAIKKDVEEINENLTYPF